MTVMVMSSKEARTRWRDLLDGVHGGRDAVIERSGQRVAVVIPYEDYEGILEELEDRRADRRAIETYEAWQRNPSGAIPWAAFEAELVAEGLLDAGPVADTD
ncbi:MAG TPA: type II toxin-antitoxin system prevent-host-death family antitoxin [Burkholderiales bacterium]|nr:type II toxin-antitoxin system prevent-host-death family antitoxin [Burkholderiales bacterium]